MKPEHIARHEQATENYLRSRKRRRLLAVSVIIALAVSVIASNAGLFGPAGDDWSRFDHRTFEITSAMSGGSLTVAIDHRRTETIQLLGIVAPLQFRDWLAERVVGRKGTLLLQTPQTRDAEHRLLAYVFVDNQNLSVELAKAGMAYADRRSKCEMDGLIDPAEAEARKKQRGLWASLKFEQMPPWRQDWLKSLSRHVRP